MKKQSGFTLIELIMVIVILGILAATAMPKFSNLAVDARKASLTGAEGAIRAAATMAHGSALAAASTVISVEGTSYTMAANHYPTGTDIMALAGVSSPSYTITGVTATAGTAQVTGATTLTSCQIVYANTGGASAVPTYTKTDTDC